VYLPAQSGTPAPRPEQSNERREGGTETVLVVEDEPAVREAIRRILDAHGYTVLEARNGVDALRVLDEVTRPIDLIITDVAMPQMGGRELVNELQARAAPSKILVMSGYDAQGVMRADALPATARFLAKPFTVDNLLHTVRVALDTSAAPVRE
jgi:CheY-like chemotaxis protein